MVVTPSVVVDLSHLIRTSLGLGLDEVMKAMDGDDTYPKGIAHQFMPESKDDYHSNKGRKTLTFCLMSIFLFISKGGSAYMMDLVEESLQGYSCMPIALAKIILCLDDTIGNLGNSLRESPIPSQVKFQTFCVILSLFTFLVEILTCNCFSYIYFTF